MERFIQSTIQPVGCLVLLGSNDSSLLLGISSRLAFGCNVVPYSVYCFRIAPRVGLVVGFFRQYYRSAAAGSTLATGQAERVMSRRSGIMIALMFAVVVVGLDWSLVFHWIPIVHQTNGIWLNVWRIGRYLFICLRGQLMTQIVIDTSFGLIKLMFDNHELVRVEQANQNNKWAYSNDVLQPVIDCIEGR